MAEETPNRLQALRRNFLHLLKKFAMFLFSHVGLTCVVVAYSMTGGWIFMSLEAPYEISQRERVAEIRSHYANAILNATSGNDFAEGNLSNTTYEIVKRFENEVYALASEGGWDGYDGEEELQWSYAGALLYSVTVITTIGYGHIAPKTSWGRVVTIIYAIFGIPMTLLCLRNVGSFLGTSFRFLYKHVCYGLMCKWQSKCYEENIHRRRNTQNLKLPLPAKGCDGENSAKATKTKVVKDKSDLDKRGEVSSQDAISDASKVEEVSSAEKIGTVVRVPVFVSLFIISAYIIGGAMLFSLWEKDWNYLVGSYFCFVTLSTIGFGDFVPGWNIDSWASQEKRVLCTLYLLFGMAMLAMCFNLMQEEIRIKCNNLAKKIGLIEKRLIDGIEDEEE